ncbi:Elongator complex protein 2 [Acorus gramineus]|uniref:Elongator complex protein 2 n=1 Tax=Acorus gramineus TaxID=55184 RepID=A0AAV9AZA8_ACOGR|nr:Elongator complex protein 2 [Acorus gramineus]
MFTGRERERGEKMIFSGVVRAEREFIGSGCNRVVNNASWGPSNLVSFGSQNAVAVFSPDSAQILTTLPGHKATVNCTHWIPSSKYAHKVWDAEKYFLLSGSSDGVIILWEMGLKDNKWRQVLQVPQPHKKGVTCIVGIMVSEAVSIFASSSSDSTVHIWELFVRACELKGHTDWIRSLDFSLPISTDSNKDSLFLVSSSQDKTIRIWKLASFNSPPNSTLADRNKDVSLTSYIEGPMFIAGSSSFQVSLESLLVGHDDWVYSVKWQPPLCSSPDGREFDQPQSILSASMDKTMMIWRPEQVTGIWVNVVTVGELSHSALGFYGACWGPHGDSILAHGYGGSFHLWKNVGVKSEQWQPHKVPSGHFAAVTDISWARSGKYLQSVSHDQTTRIFAPWKNTVSLQDRSHWHEIARPQVHGHDINCVAIIQGKGNHRFVSGADEKVARVFEAPSSFLKTLNLSILGNSEFVEESQGDVHILGANMSALGLSQKPIYFQSSGDSSKKSNQGVSDSLETIPDAVPTVLTEPPVEEQLAWHTLWPESHKLYGHGNELFSLCCDHEGKLVASSCKAQSAPVAEIWLWQVGSWKAVGRLQAHSLTVTQMEFSHDDRYLLAVSRDRHFSIFSIKNSGVDEISYQPVAKHDAHKRIIWACSWNPFGHEFATGSRDKTVKIWAVENETSVKQLIALPQFSSSVTALSWVGRDRLNNVGFLAVGMESGLIELWNISGRKTANDGLAPTNVSAGLALRFDPFLCHVSTVQRFAWRNSEAGDSGSMQLASCGDDNCVRVFKVHVD